MNQMRVIAGLMIVLVSGTSCDSKAPLGSALAPDPANPSATMPALDSERKLISLSRTKQSMMAMAFKRTTPPPWERGNTLKFREIHPPTIPGGLEEQANWSVVNIHAENLFEITKRLGIDVLETRIVHRRQPSEIQETGRVARKVIADLGYVVFTNPQIPKEWLLKEPSCDREIGRQLRRQLPEAFRPK